MGKDARKYTEKTIKRLFALSGNECAFPGCTKKLVNQQNAKDSNICHIEGANLGSERYREDMSDKERADYDNLILLCIQHHDETNDVNVYTVDVLKKMKKDHESRHLQEVLGKNPSMLRNAINAIASIDLEEHENEQILDAFDIETKLSHNSVKKYYPLIQDYKVYHMRINSLYDELEAQGSLKKSKILKNVRGCYLRAKGKYADGSGQVSIETIRNHADDIIDEVLNSLYENLNKQDIYEDDILIGLDLIMVDAFMRCKILEEPPK